MNLNWLETTKLDQTVGASRLCSPTSWGEHDIYHNPDKGISHRNTLVRQGATLGANCTVVCGVTIGRYAFIGAGAVINKDVPDYALMVGVPARQIGWMSEYGEQLDLPLSGHEEAQCPHTQQRYRLSGQKLVQIQS